MKIRDKIVIVVCSVCMAFICCFGISYKIANKTYADLTPITDKQRLGAFLSSLAFSAGVRFYISTVGMYEWLVDNFNSVMLRLQFNMALQDVYNNALDNFDNENKTYTLDPEFTKAVQEYLKYLKGEGINEYSGVVELGTYEENDARYYEAYGDLQSQADILANSSPGYTYTYKYYVRTTSSDVRFVNLAIKRASNFQYETFICAVKKDAFPNLNYKVEMYQNGTYYSTPWQGSYAYQGIYTINGENYYIRSLYEVNLGSSQNSGIDKLISSIHPFYMISGSHPNRLSDSAVAKMAYDYTFGSDSGSVTSIPFTGEPNRYWAETEITLDRDAEYKVDYSETDGAEDTSTLDELVELINQLIDTGTDQEQETIPQVDVEIFTPTIDPTTIDIPTLFDGIPEIITPDCVGLGPCLLSGVQSVSQHLQSIYNSNGSVANYTLVSLAIGVALYILTGGI